MVLCIICYIMLCSIFLMLLMYISEQAVYYADTGKSPVHSCASLYLY